MQRTRVDETSDSVVDGGKSVTDQRLMDNGVVRFGRRGRLLVITGEGGEGVQSFVTEA